jgi:hypothetical protein
MPLEFLRAAKRAGALVPRRRDLCRLHGSQVGEIITAGSNSRTGRSAPTNDSIQGHDETQIFGNRLTAPTGNLVTLSEDLAAIFVRASGADILMACHKGAA